MSRMVLSLGVFEFPYSVHVPEAGRRAVSRLRKGSPTLEKFTSAPAGAETTGDVATFLEAKYHVIEIFYQENQQQIADLVANSMAGALETMMMGQVPSDPMAGAMSAIEKMFKNWILSGAMEKLGYPGVPTKAALAGVNHALKMKKGPRRPSFKDTGLYMSAFHAWMSNG